MSSRSTLARTLAGALAIAALAAPAALARPAQDPSAGGGTAQARSVQNLRSPDAQDAASGTTAQARSVQNLRSPDAEDAATQAVQSTGSASPQARYYASYGEPASIPQPARQVSTGGGTDWTMIAAALAALLILGGSAAMAGRSRLRTRRTAATA